ncbi:MAG: hypothetical protein C4K47_01120 [Candidatus Thorarchaeota archaeon]|nr:MAG: hypothetical protein C4K47_01120 [Candidatus Thorarchaeota archaeon]
MIARRFAVGFRDIPIDVEQVKSGLNSRETVVACRCVNVALFLSGSIRRNVEVSVCVGDDADLRVISFSGGRIKRVSPDERSISSFLLKAMLLLDKMHLGTVRFMDNGIVLSRTDLPNLVRGWSAQCVHIADSSAHSNDWKNVSREGLFVYDLADVISRQRASTWSVLLHRPSNPERFILDVNFHCDPLETSLLKKGS